MPQTNLSQNRSSFTCFSAQADWELNDIDGGGRWRERGGGGRDREEDERRGIKWGLERGRKWKVKEDGRETGDECEYWEEMEGT